MSVANDFNLAELVGIRRDQVAELDGEIAALQERRRLKARELEALERALQDLDRPEPAPRQSKRKPPKYSAAQLRSEILRLAAVEAGSSVLPTRRELAERLGVALNVVNRCVNALILEGKLRPFGVDKLSLAVPGIPG